MKTKELYVTAEIELVKFGMSDVIETSGGNDIGEDSGENDGEWM